MLGSALLHAFLACTLSLLFDGLVRLCLCHDSAPRNSSAPRFNPPRDSFHPAIHSTPRPLLSRASGFPFFQHRLLNRMSAPSARLSRLPEIRAALTRLSRGVAIMPGVALLLLLLVSARPAEAQMNPRIGVGFQMMASTIEDNVGPGVRMRISAPINRDLSVAVGTGFTGYVFEGQDDANYAIDPTLSLIVTLPVAGRRGTYFLGGIGAYVPLGEFSSEAAPFFHFGFGRVWLLQDTSIFFEFAPALVVGDESAEGLFPVRVGVIF